MSFFENKVFETITEYNMLSRGDCVLVGLSGGADSCSLLFVLYKLQQKLGIKIICAHLNHGIRGTEAQRDMEFSKRFAKELGIDCITESVNVPQYAKDNKLSEETAGRNLRYDFFKRVCQRFNCNKIAVAHNKNDRAETILMNMIRGCGSNGFFGIKPINDNVIRPLINVSRPEIEAYANENKIRYVTDSTNNEDIYTRNLVRNKILPDMAKINPKVIDNIIRTSDIISAQTENYTDSLLKICVPRYMDRFVIYPKKVFQNLTDTDKKQLILHAVSMIANSTENISSAQLHNVLSTLATGKTFKLGSEITILYTHNDVTITSEMTDDTEYEYSISESGKCYVCETGITYIFEYVDCRQNEANTIYIAADDYEIKDLILRTKRDGDLFFPSGLKGSKKVKKYFIDSKIPQHQRHLYPLLELNGEILAILPLRVSDKYKVIDTTKKILKITVHGGTYDEK